MVISTLSRGKPRRYVLDANALIGFLEDRAGTSSRVRRLLEEAFRHDLPLLLSAVNWGEVFYISWRQHGEAKQRDRATGEDGLVPHYGHGRFACH